ncbi:MAG TPA: VOC family protein [Gemmatimonadaceae bacterium]|jgi:catechol 2,3-dioxygenase-like lactoylglutathione lyase family enzyme|nr:VOC family protein [Gemmatimonadaceae bacterium]
MEPGIAIPILPARHLGETRTFYERLGFNATGWWPKEFGGYAILRKGDLSVHFFAFDDIDPLENYAQCYWRVNDADALYRECRAAGLARSGTPRLTDIADRLWGMREFSIVDPNGNLVRIGHEIAKKS